MKKQFLYTRRFVWTTLGDARAAAAQFLNRQADLAETEVEMPLRRAAQICQTLAQRVGAALKDGQLFQAMTDGVTVDQWSKSTQLAEREAIAAAREADGAIIGQLRAALAAMPRCEHGPGGVVCGR